MPDQGPGKVGEYVKASGSTVEDHGGRYLVAGVVPEQVEGDTWPDGKVSALIEFPTMAKLKQWYDSPEYAKARLIRDEAVTARVIFVDGNA
ncbi:DUF1330 domain-containing protein [Kibdelosporangium aridum]|uniref:DUF1330 domain-containing protein n=1 Tax=Kibdelosporangium aridum TaxID=2030 RepID=A0A428YIJ5_KIBAR|nr:DUF1330 domain-containing protein [Kibdelosporangium aridum]RSM67413.1 DUF1330 domain-containing protein [Kibdelosporangium aridum]